MGWNAKIVLCLNSENVAMAAYLGGVSNTNFKFTIGLKCWLCTYFVQKQITTMN